MDLLLGVASYIVFVLALPFLLTHPKLRDGFRKRMGWYDADWPALPAGPRVWVHGASAGDVLALIPTLRELKRLRPEVQIVLSTITNSGRLMAERERRAFDAITYLPYDVPGPVNRTLQRIAPRVLVLEYTELWPRLIRAASRRGIALVLHNGRFADARLRGYRRLFALTGNLLAPFRLLLMRDEREGDNARRLGAPEQALHVTGNTKFDNVSTEVPALKVGELRAAAALPEDAPVWVAGSTHEGEEELLLQVFLRLRRSFPALRMIIAPRYVERAERIAAMAAKTGLSTRLRSKPGDAVDVLVLDTIGELAACYTLASLVFVGGSFVRRGGQNILEPAACGKPVLFGPYMQNFADSVQALLGRGGIQVANAEQLERVLADLLQRDEHRRELGDMAREQVLAVRGAAGRNAELIARLL